MKIHNCLKKFFCLILSSVLLISNTQVFAQNNEVPPIFTKEVRTNLDKQVEELRNLLTKLEEKVKKANEVKFTEHVTLLEEMSNDIDLIERKYKILCGELENYNAELSKISGDVDATIEANKAFKEGHFRYEPKKQNVAEALARRYYGTGTVIDPSTTLLSKEYMRGAMDFRSTLKVSEIKAEHAKKGYYVISTSDMNKRLGAIQRLRDEVTAADIVRQNVLDSESKAFVKLARVADLYDANTLWEIAFSHLTDKQKAAVNLVIKAGEEKSAYKIQKALNEFYAKFKGHAKLGPLATLKLSRTFKGLTTTQRMGMMETITEIGPNEKYLAETIVKKPGAAGKFLKTVSPMMIVTVVLTAAFITDVNAHNAFPKFASITEKRKVQLAIENDEKMSAASLIRWYTDPENVSIIEKNKAHYMNQIAVLFSAAQANQDQEGILAVMREMDPDPGLETAQVQDQTEKKFDAALGQYI